VGRRDVGSSEGLGRVAAAGWPRRGHDSGPGPRVHGATSVEPSSDAPKVTPRPAHRAGDPLGGRGLLPRPRRRYHLPLGWGRSSVGRASRSQCEGRGFDSHRLHHPLTRPGEARLIGPGEARLIGPGEARLIGPGRAGLIGPSDASRGPSQGGRRLAPLRRRTCRPAPDAGPPRTGPPRTGLPPQGPSGSARLTECGARLPAPRRPPAPGRPETPRGSICDRGRRPGPPPRSRCAGLSGPPPLP
jgi:hypothetical protein